MTDGYEAIYRTMLDAAGGSEATEGRRLATSGGEPRPLKPVMSDLAASGRAS